MATATLEPDSDVNTGWVLVGAATRHQALTDTSDSTVIAATGYGNTQTLGLSNTPSDFSSMTGVTAVFRWLRQSTDDTVGCQMEVIDPDTSTRLAGASSDAPMQVVANAAGTTSMAGASVGFSYVDSTAAKAQWDRSQLNIVSTGAQVMSADSPRAVQIAKVSLSLTYDTSVPTNFVDKAGGGLARGWRWWGG